MSFKTLLVKVHLLRLCYIYLGTEQKKVTFYFMRDLLGRKDKTVIW
jgi:hypothetical protein